MADVTQLYESLKSRSWNHKIDVDAEKRKWYNVSAMLNALEKPFDELAVATACFNNATPGSKYYGMSVQEIITMWKTKCSYMGNMGMNLDTYIQAALRNKPKPIIDDPVLLNKCNQFDILKRDIIDTNLTFIGSEIWLNSKHYAFRGRMDALFQVNNTEYLTIFDWKNNEELKYNNFERMLGPCDFLQKSDLNKFTIQLYLYKYLLENEFEQKVKGVRIAHIKEHEYNLYKPTFEYDKKFMEEVINWCINECDRRAS